MEKKDEAKESWLNSQKQSTRTYYKCWFAKFEEFTKMTGDEILADRKADKEYRWEAKVLAFRNWLLKEKKLSGYTVTAMAMAVRGFFGYHRVKLEFRRTETQKLSEKTRLTEDYRFSLEDLKKLFEVADLEERYVVSAGKSFGLRAGDFLRLTRGDLEPYIDREVPISIGIINTAKEKVKAFPFIDTDAQPIVKLMLEKMTRDGRTQPSDRILEFKQDAQLTRILQRLVERAGLNVGNKEVRFHNLRKFLCDHLSSFMSESKWKQIIGKQISEGAYISPDDLQKDYARAMAETTFTKAFSGDVESQVKKQIFLQTLKNLNISEAEVKAMVNARLRRRPTNLAEEVEAIEKILEEKKAAENCEDGKHCETQKVVSEAELSKFLSEGWQVVTALQSGSVVIQRQS